MRGREPSGQGSRVRTPRYTCSLKKASSNLIVSLLTKIIRYKFRGRVVVPGTQQRLGLVQ